MDPVQVVRASDKKLCCYPEPLIGFLVPTPQGYLNAAIVKQNMQDVKFPGKMTNEVDVNTNTST